MPEPRRPQLTPAAPPTLLDGIVGGGFLIGLAWGLYLAAALAGTELAGEPLSLSARSSRIFLALLLGIGHGTLIALVGDLVRRGRFSRRWPRAAAIGLALGFGLPYAWGVLSVLKFRSVGAHLRYEDFWFLLRSLAQLSAETTGTERTLLLAVALLPIGLAAALLVAMALGRRIRGEATLPRLLLLLALTAAGLLAVGWSHPGARQAARVLYPDTRALVAWLGSSGPIATGRPDGAAGDRIEPYVASPAAEPWNVVVLMLESIPWKRLHGPEARPESTPRLAELARESVVFDRAYATSTHSDYAQTSILASLHPRKFPGHDYFRDLSYPRTLFWDPLHGLGYRTAVFSCQNERWGNMIAFHQTDGLELFRHSPDWPDASRRGEGAESKVFEPAPVGAFFDWIDREPGRPFAVYLNFQATHYPYVVPDGFTAPYAPSTLDFATTFLSYPTDKIPVMLNRFHNALAYVDLHVGQVVDGLRRRGLWERTVLFVVSDHGEAFYEHGLPTHGTTLLEEQVRTAMLLRVPGVEPRALAEPVSVLDGVPAIYRALGLPRHGNFQGRDDVLDESYSAAGRSLLFTIQGMTREEGLLFERFKYIVNWDRRERALFDLERDPDERVNLAATAPDELARMDRELLRLLELQLGYYQSRGWERGRYPPRLP